MNIALLFNSDHPKFSGYYGDPIKATIFSTGLIQNSNRHMKMSVGDVLVYGHHNYDAINEALYFHSSWSLIHEDRLRSTFHRATVTAVIYENMPSALATSLHHALAFEDSYLGLQSIDHTHGPHLALYRNLMIPKYRLVGTTARIFYSMSDTDGRDEYAPILLKQWGYTDIDWEDTGAHHTTFDDYDTLAHFQQVGDFRDAVAPHLAGGEDAAFELVMLLEDLNPRLFNALGAAVVVLHRAVHDDHVAQAALAGRRYIERLADALFPGRDEHYKTRKVTKDRYRTRLWAYLDENLSADPERVKILDAELKRIDGEFNAGLHDEQPAGRILRALADVGELTAAFLAINPAAARKPYLAHEKTMLEFYRTAAQRYNPDA